MKDVSYLPIEVLEKILYYLDGSDIYAWCEATNNYMYNVFWKHLCKRDGVVNNFLENDYKQSYWINLNWKLCRYDVKKTTFNSPPTYLHKTNILIRCENSYQVWNLEGSDPVLKQEMPLGAIDSYGTTIALQQAGLITMYKINHESRYDKFKTLLINDHEIYLDSDMNGMSAPLINDERIISLSDKFLVCFQKKCKLLSVLNIKNEYNYFMHLPKEYSFVLNLQIMKQYLYVLAVSSNNYVLKKIHLEKQIWDKEILISQNACMTSVPKIKVNENFIVSVGRNFLSSNFTPLKIWNTSGDLLKTVNKIEPMASFWFCLENHFVIYPSTSRMIEVWKSTVPSETKKIHVEHGFLDGSTGPNSVLVLTYKEFFDVIDYRTGDRLYRTDLEYGFNKPPLINQYFYIHFGFEKDLGYKISMFDFHRNRSGKAAPVKSNTFAARLEMMCYY